MSIGYSIRKHQAALLISVGIIGLITSGIIYIRQPKPPKVTSVTVAAATSSVKPAAKVVSQYTVPATDPRYIAISSIGVGNTPVEELGLLKDGSIATPNNIYETGWYGGSAKPGQPGAMFIYGHVSSWTADGVFYNLKKLVPGDTVTVTRGDNQQFTYKVITSKVYPYNNVDMKAVLSPVQASIPGLNLMTCTGKVISGTSEFNERLVVFTSLVKG